jgi:16S rRNA G966 N2-methylase RsmD
MVPIEALLSKDVVSFIQQHKNMSVADLMLKMPAFSIDSKWIAAQIEGWQKAMHKLPLWANTDGIIFPVRLSMEQCSSERTGLFKASLVRGSCMVDLTGGLGVDTFYISKSFKKAYYIEQQEELGEIATHNFSVLGQTNISTLIGNSAELLLTLGEKIDLIYLDPARRKETQKVFKLSDCEPDITSLQDLYFSVSTHILIKTSPMLDITEAQKQLQGVKDIYIVSIDNECKEVLYLLEKDYVGKPNFICVHDYKKILQTLSFTAEAEQTHKAEFANPDTFLYEPNPSILKAGGFNSVAQQHKVSKLQASSHLYTSNEIVREFPGRIFTIKHIIGYNKKEVQAIVPGGKANIQTRNFPDSVENIRKKTGLKDGGNIFIFATTLQDASKVLIVCEKYTNN